MKFLSSEYTVNHPWETVAQAQFRKYPNPITSAIIGTDVIDRKIENGILHTHRLISSKWWFPQWAQALIGTANICYASEHSEVDPKSRNMTLKTKNITFGNYIAVDETLSYTPHPHDKNKTLLTQETVVSVKGVPFTHYMEDLLTSKISFNAEQGRQALEWVINKLEVSEFTNNAVKSTDELISRAGKQIDDFTEKTKRSMQSAAKISLDEIQHFATPSTSQSMPEM